MSSPRFAPWLMPETISSGGASIRPSSAKRTQSTGVPSVANPVVPSPNSTSSTQIGSRRVTARPVALRFESGAITSSSTSGSSSRARRMAFRPGALMPSSLVRSTLTLTASRVCDALEVEPVRGSRRPRLASRTALEELREAVRLCLLQHRPDQHADHVAHECVGLDPEREDVAGLLDPLGAEDVALEAHVVRLGRRECGEVVRAGERRCAAVERVAVEWLRPPERPPLLERAGRGARVKAVAVGARARVAAGVEAVGGRIARERRDVGGQQRVQVADGAHVAVMARDVNARVQAAVGSAGDGQRHLAAQDGGERALDGLLHGPEARLRRPTGEVRAVVLEQETSGQPRLRATIRAYSFWTSTGPSPPA